MLRATYTLQYSGHTTIATTSFQESSVDSEDPIEVMKGVLSAAEHSRQEVFLQLHAAKVKVTSLEHAGQLRPTDGEQEIGSSDWPCGPPLVPTGGDEEGD